jgi:hypothetical protein
MHNQQFIIEPGNGGFSIAETQSLDMAGILNEGVRASRGVAYEFRRLVWGAIDCCPSC